MNIIATTRECVCDVSLDSLSGDLRRMLKVQFKEFIHSIDDHTNMPICKVYDITDTLEELSKRKVG
jgi:hypothetical protein